MFFKVAVYILNSSESAFRVPHMLVIPCFVNFSFATLLCLHSILLQLLAPSFTFYTFLGAVLSRHTHWLLVVMKGESLR